MAYTVSGEGPVDIVYVEGAFTHLEVSWEVPLYRRFCERLGEFARVIRFDKRGMGMSDRVPGGTTLETRMDDIRAVMDAAGSERAAIIGESEGGPLAMLFAAAHPERARALILQGAEVRERKDDDWPWGEATPQEHEAYMAAIPERWGLGGNFPGILPSLGDVPWGREYMARRQRNAATPGAWEAFARMAFDIDVRHVAPTIKVPTLIFHSQGDQVCHVENARFLARTIEGARYVETDGSDHVPWAEDCDRFIAEVRQFLTGERESAIPDRVLATVLFTDIVGSTEQRDGAWRRPLARAARRTPPHHPRGRRRRWWSRGGHGRRRRPGDLRWSSPCHQLRPRHPACLGAAGHRGPSWRPHRGDRTAGRRCRRRCRPPRGPRRGCLRGG